MPLHWLKGRKNSSPCRLDLPGAVEVICWLPGVASGTFYFFNYGDKYTAVKCGRQSYFKYEKIKDIQAVLLEKHLLV